MSYAVDANVLVYASDAASPFNQRARTFLETCASGTEIFCLAWSTAMAYLRIATHPGIFQRPLSPEDAVANLDPSYVCHTSGCLRKRKVTGTCTAK